MTLKSLLSFRLLTAIQMKHAMPSAYQACKLAVANKISQPYAIDLFLNSLLYYF